MNRWLVLPLFVLGFLAQGPAVQADDEAAAAEVGIEVLEAAPEGATKPRLGDRIRFTWKATLADGTLLGQSKDNNPSTLRLVEGASIRGLLQAVPKIQVGSKVRLTIPAALAYGEKGLPGRKAGDSPRVPPGADLVYELHLLECLAQPVFHPVAEGEWVELGPGIQMKILEPGNGEALPLDERIEVEYALWNHRKRIVESTFHDGIYLDGIGTKLKRTRKQQVRESFLATILPKMEKGGRYWLRVHPSRTYGDKKGFGVSPGTHTYWELAYNGTAEIPVFKRPARSDLTTTPSGLQYQVLRKGSGRRARPGSDIDVHYAGWLEAGRQFDSSIPTGAPFRTDLMSVIRGWTEGIALMREGGVYRFVIPARLAYGADGRPGIPPNATLVFWVEVLKVW